MNPQRVPRAIALLILNQNHFNQSAITLPVHQAIALLHDTIVIANREIGYL
jgi:hypothetical protein